MSPQAAERFKNDREKYLKAFQLQLVQATVESLAMEKALLEGNTEGTGESRWALWKHVGLGIFVQNPIFGVGAHNTGPVAVEIIPPGLLPRPTSSRATLPRCCVKRPRPSRRRSTSATTASCCWTCAASGTPRRSSSGARSTKGWPWRPCGAPAAGSSC